MTVTVLLFGPYAASTGTSSATMEVSTEPCTAAEVLAALQQRWPAAGSLWSKARLAVDHGFVPGDYLVRAGDELAVIGLVSGG